MLYVRVRPRLSFSTKRIGPSCCTLVTFVTCYSLQFILSQNYLSPTISVLAEKTLLKTAYHFLLILIGFDALTYRKDYDRSPILVGHHSCRRPLHFIKPGRQHRKFFQHIYQQSRRLIRCRNCGQCTLGSGVQLFDKCVDSRASQACLGSGCCSWDLDTSQIG